MTFSQVQDIELNYMDSILSPIKHFYIFFNRIANNTINFF